MSTILSRPRYLEDRDPWMLAEDIPDIDFQFSQLWLSSFVNDLERTVGRNYTKVLSVYHGLNLAFYYGEQDSADFAEHLLRLITETPAFAEKINTEIRRLSDRLREAVQPVAEESLTRMSDQELATLYRTWDDIHTELYTYGWLPNAVDMFHGNLTQWIRKQMSTVLPPEEVNKAMVLVTVTSEKSVVQQEHESLLHIAVLKRDNDPRFEEMLKKHYDRYFYFKFLWLGKEGVYSMNDYRKAVEAVLQENLSPEQRLQAESNLLTEQLTEREQLLGKFSHAPGVVAVFNAYAEFALTKVYRRDVQLLWSYKMSFVFAELAKRFQISKEEARFLLPSEVQEGLENGFSADIRQEVARRATFCVYYAEKEVEVVLTGDEAQKLALKISTKEHGEIAELKGQVACMGRVRGVVRIVNSVSDMAKIQKGEILVSIATNPDIVPAMKIAAAIVTEQGGITSHAAIVSRELNVPCIIGTKIATKVLRDGDEVDVDANQGIVKVLKRA